MKLRVIILSAVICCFPIALLAQDKEKIEALPAGSTLEQSREWLVKTIDKYFGYSLVEDTVSISKLKFDGCKVSYRMFQRYTDQKSTLGDQPALGQTGATGAKDLNYEVYEDVSFDLKDIDPTRVGLGPLPRPRSMQMVSLETAGKKDLIHFERKGTSVRYNTTGDRSTVAFPVKEKAGEAIAKAFMYTVQLCKTSK
jgi:hypothetical protein